jgi:hypothetical protein
MYFIILITNLNNRIYINKYYYNRHYLFYLLYINFIYIIYNLNTILKVCLNKGLFLFLRLLINSISLVFYFLILSSLINLRLALTP